VVGGLAFSQIVTLYVTPVFYTYLDAFQHRLGRRRRPPPELVRRSGKEEALKPESAAVG
jgi:hydrophobic/amphiphilic exporter-1 (mainly G- bacteria), HAE1 family